MPLSPSVSMMNGRQPVPAATRRMHELPPIKRPPRPMIRPMLSLPRRTVDEVAISKLPPPPKSRFIQNGRLKIPITRSRTSDLNELNDRRSLSRESSYVSRSPSPAYSHSTNRSGSSLSNYDTWCSSESRSRSANTPRRQFPQTYTDHSIDMHEFYKMDQSPVVYDANLSFMLGMKQPMRQRVHASPAHSEKSTASSFLTDQISNFLKRTDHVMEEWSAMGRKKDDTVSYIERQREQISADRGVGRSRSATNILVRGFQLTKSQPSQRRSMSRDINEIPRDQLREDDDRTVCDEEVKRFDVYFDLDVSKVRLVAGKISFQLKYFRRDAKKAFGQRNFSVYRSCRKSFCFSVSKAKRICVWSD